MTDIHYIRSVTQIQGLQGILLHQKDRCSAFGNGLQRIHDLIDNDGSQTQTRLIKHQQLRPRHQPAGYGKHLLLSAGKEPAKLRLPLLKTGKKLVNLFQILLDAIFIITLAAADTQVFQNGQFIKNLASFRNDRNAALNNFMTLPR